MADPLPVGQAGGRRGINVVNGTLTTPLFRKVDCLSIPVPDLDAALAFYSAKLGHELIWRSRTAAGLKLPGSTAELVLHTAGRPMETDLTVDSVPDALDRFTSAGGRVLRGPFEIQIGLCAVVADPWDNVLVILDTAKGALQVDEVKRVIERNDSIGRGAPDAMPQNVYDDPEFFAGYSQLPRSRGGLAATPEWPALRRMLPPLEGARVLDLGCGFGAFARWAREMGAASVLGVDRSENMLARARAETRDPAVTYTRAAIEDLALPVGAFDLVYSSLALHYIEDFGAVCGAIRRLLTPGGHLVCSVEHPLFTAPTRPGWRTEGDGARVWPLDAYLLEGRRVTDWITPGVVKYHRTIASYVNPLLAHEFRLVRLEEWGPTEEQIAAHPEWADEVHRPPFLLIAAGRPAAGLRCSTS